MNVPSAVLAKLLEKGLTLADVVEIADLWETASPAKEPTANAIRQRRFRQRKAEGVTEVVTVTRDCNDKDVSPKPPSESTPIPPLKGGTFPKSEQPQPPEKPIAEAEKPLSGWVSEIWEITTPAGRKRSGKPALEAALKAAKKRGEDLGRIKSGLASYYASTDATKDGGAFSQGVHTAIRNGRWEAFAEDGATEPITDDDPWRVRLLRWKTAAYWNSEWGPKPDRPGYLGPPLDIAA